MEKADPNKPMRNAIAVVLRSNAHPGAFLAVLRPNEGGDLQGIWGLPAVRMRPGELPEDAARRVCREKLGCEAVPLRLTGTMFQKRPEYDMFFMDMEMLVVDGGTANVHAATSKDTVYVNQRWAKNPRILLPAARKGSCCSTIFLTQCGVLQRGEWVTTLDDVSGMHAAPNKA
ncbi:MAG TPA: NUDIX hydrolase [Candidatus Saccharimonadales bacterium]|nr:NUDIX hydrolase [Candidatus Saccharimonadales bacterium]